MLATPSIIKFTLMDSIGYYLSENKSNLPMIPFLDALAAGTKNQIGISTKGICRRGPAKATGPSSFMKITLTTHKNMDTPKNFILHPVNLCLALLCTTSCLTPRQL